MVDPTAGRTEPEAAQCSVRHLREARGPQRSPGLLRVQLPASQPAWAGAPGGFRGGQVFQVFERTVNKVESHHPRAHM